MSSVSVLPYYDSICHGSRLFIDDTDTWLQEEQLPDWYNATDSLYSLHTF